MTRTIRTLLTVGLLATTLLFGCSSPEKQYGTEVQLFLPAGGAQVWAVAPAVDLSGQNIDPLLQADLVFGQLQQVKGLTVIPVNRVAEVYASLKIPQVQSEEQAAVVCDLLGCDALLVPTITMYDPYNPPKFGASLQLFRKGMFIRADNVDPRALAREASPSPMMSVPANGNFQQAVGMFDAAAGSTRQALWLYADGRNDPVGPLGSKEYLVSMDRYCGFAWHSLIRELFYKTR